MSRARENGFTLLEVLVAVAVLAIAMTAITQSLSNSTRNLGHLQQRNYATQVAINVLEKSYAGRLSQSRGKAELGHRNWYWTLERERLRVPALGERAGDLTQLTVNVYADENRRRLLASLNGVEP